MAKLVKTIFGGLTAPLRVFGPDAPDVSEPPLLRAPSLEMQTVGSSEEEEDSFDVHIPPCSSKRGLLSKWTNYLHGWQDRYFNVADGLLSYYKSEVDTKYGCRGSVSLQRAIITCHEFDELRFDIRVHDCTYFLRAASVEEKQQWIDVIEANKIYLQDLGNLDTNIRRQGSILSLASIHSVASVASCKKNDLQEKLSEIDTFRAILCRQLDTLQNFFDAQMDYQAQQNGTRQNRKSGSDESIPDDEGGKSDQSEIRESLDSGLDFNAGNSATTSSSESTNEHTVRGWSEAGDQTPPRVHTLPYGQRHSPIMSNYRGHKRTGSDPFAFRNYPTHTKLHPRVSHGFTSCSPPPHIDFKSESTTFKATTIGILTSLQQVIDMVYKREETWQQKLDKEQERRRKAEVAAHAAMNGPKAGASKYAGPDYEEGPHSVLKEEEFFDALEFAYQNEEGAMGKEEGTDGLEEVDTSVKIDTEESPSINQEAIPDKLIPQSITGVEHRMSEMVSEKTALYAKYIFEPVDNHWGLTHEDGDMKVYRRELEENGIVVDPLKAQFTVKGVTARECVEYFFNEDTRLEWEGTLESVKRLETLADDTIIFHQFHKRVWPSTQRDTVFCSHLCTLPNAPHPDNMIGRTWMVCNFSIDHDKAPQTSKLIRATLHAGMVCQTLVEQPVEKGRESNLKRNEVTCKMTYAVNVNPGGWAPPAVVRTIGKREVTKFLKKFGSIVEKAVKHNPVTL